MTANSLRAPGSPLQFQASQGQAGAQGSAVKQSNVAVWLGAGTNDGMVGDVQPAADAVTAQQQHSTHDYMRCMGDLVLLEDCSGRAPIDDLCVACGNRYRKGLGMLGSNAGGENCRQLVGRTGEDTVQLGSNADVNTVCFNTIGSILGNVHQVVGTQGGPSVQNESDRAAVLGTENSECRCGGNVWSCAVEQSLKVCAVVAPDALRASRRPGVLGVPQCGQKGPEGASGETAVVFSDLPKEVRVLICQRSCIASGLLQ